MQFFWLLFVFVVGLNVGSFLNVVVARLPLEKSVLWPSSRCMNCLQAIRWYDNIPVLSYLILRGKCRTCGAGFSVRYPLVELTTGLAFSGLFYLEMMINVHDWPATNPFLIRQGWYPPAWWIGYWYHVVLFSFLFAASVCDLEGRVIPLQITLVGTLIGLVGAVFVPWPWPHDTAAAMPIANPAMDPTMAWMFSAADLKQGVYPWPFWGPLPSWAAPGGNWQTGLATGLAGAFVGTFLLRLIGFVFGLGLGREALGLGDADLMMMAGAFLGWQPIVIGFFLSIAPALVFGAINIAFRGDHSLPFGPSLAVGVLAAMLGWRWLGPHFQPLFFWSQMMIGLLAIMVVFLFLSAFLLGRLRPSMEEIVDEPSDRDNPK